MDFSDGRIVRSRFEDTGNDAMDFSGATVEIDVISARRIGDKGMSVGEASRMTIRSLTVAVAKIGIAA